MVNRRLKQGLAIFVAVAFVLSIIFFIPHVPNGNLVTYELLVPNSLIVPTSPFYSLAPKTFSNQNVSSLGGFFDTKVSEVVASTNATNLLQLTEYILKNNNIGFNSSNGLITCIYSTNFTKSICDNSTYSWYLFSGIGNSLSLGYGGFNNPSLASISLDSIYQTNLTFVLVYLNPNLNSVNTNSSSGAARSTIPILK